MGKGPMDQIKEEEFRAIVCEIWKRISLLGRWTGSGAWGSEYAEDEDLMRRLGDIFWRKKNSFAINPTKYSDELWYSTLFLAQKSATNRGHGEALIAFWKNSSSDYHLQHNVGIILLLETPCPLVGPLVTFFTPHLKGLLYFSNLANSISPKLQGVFLSAWHNQHLHWCVGHTAWAPVGREGRSQAGPKGHQLEGGALRAPKLLV